MLFDSFFQVKFLFVGFIQAKISLNNHRYRIIWALIVFVKLYTPPLENRFIEPWVNLEIALISGLLSVNVDVNQMNPYYGTLAKCLYEIHIQIHEHCYSILGVPSKADPSPSNQNALLVLLLTFLGCQEAWQRRLASIPSCMASIKTATSRRWYVWSTLLTLIMLI